MHKVKDCVAMKVRDRVGEQNEGSDVVVVLTLDEGRGSRSRVGVEPKLCEFIYDQNQPYA